LVLLPLLAVLAMPAQARRDDPIYVPDPIQVPAGKSAEAVKQVIRKALFDRQWEMREIGAGHIQGMYTKKGRKGSSVTIVVDIRFDGRAVRMTYKDSENMNYDAQSGTINGNYNKWVRNVEATIRKELGSY
jgi:hypothetical protein